MPSSVRVREDFSAGVLRALAKRSKDANQSRRLLSLAAVRDGMDRGAAAKIGGLDRRTLRDRVHCFNAAGPKGLVDHWTNAPTPRLKAAASSSCFSTASSSGIAAVTASADRRMATAQLLFDESTAREIEESCEPAFPFTAAETDRHPAGRCPRNC